MAETTAVNYLLAGLRGPLVRAHCVKHNDVNAGVVDASASLDLDTVWIEVKASAAWPARPGTRVWWAHYTEEQALFLRRRNAWLCVRIGREYFWFNREQAWEIWEERGWPQERMRREAWAYWARGMDFEELKRVLWD